VLRGLVIRPPGWIGSRRYIVGNQERGEQIEREVDYLPIHSDQSRKEIHFYRLHRSCRPAALARICGGVGDADAIGWPVKVRDGRRQRERK
jgi:hypothetical protein